MLVEWKIQTFWCQTFSFRCKHVRERVLPLKKMLLLLFTFLTVKLSHITQVHRFRRDSLLSTLFTLYMIFYLILFVIWPLKFIECFAEVLKCSSSRTRKELSQIKSDWQAQQQQLVSAEFISENMTDERFLNLSRPPKKQQQPSKKRFL